jgi:myb proto-oncogene protein
MQQEDEQLVLLHAEVGNQWAVLARSMPGRTDNAIKNRWNATLHKRVLAGDYNYLLQEGQWGLGREGGQRSVSGSGACLDVAAGAGQHSWLTCT